MSVQKDILKVLTTEWQTSRIIAMRVVLPPEIIYRRLHKRREKNQQRGEFVERVNVVSQALHNLCRQGKVEKRKSAGGNCGFERNEYRLIHPLARNEES